MDTISRENNSMLPVGGIIVGVIALLLGGYSAITLSKVNKSLALHDEKIAKIDGIESQVTTAAAASEKASKDLSALRTSTQSAFDTVGGELVKLGTSVTRLEESAKKPAVGPLKKGATSSEPVVAGPNEHIVKSKETGVTIAHEAGVSLSDLMKVNPDINWSKLKVGDKVKLPAKK